MSFDQIKIQMQHIIDDMLAAGNQAGDVVENLVNTFSLDREFASEYLTRFLEQKLRQVEKMTCMIQGCEHPAEWNVKYTEPDSDGLTVFEVKCCGDHLKVACDKKAENTVVHELLFEE